MNPLLSVDIARSFQSGSRILARFVILEEMQGRVLVVTGESGSGRSTLLRMLSGLISPDTGSIYWNGDAWFDSQNDENCPVRQRGIGYLPQGDTLFPHMTVRENLLFAIEARKGTLASMWSRLKSGRNDCLEEAMSRFELLPLSRSRPENQSGGQRRRVSVCRMFLLNPSILLLDEPLNGLDPKAKGEIGDLLRHFLEDRRIPGLWVTHDPFEALSGRISSDWIRTARCRDILL